VMSSERKIRSRTTAPVTPDAQRPASDPEAR
jgi:hypothetical protein